MPWGRVHIAIAGWTSYPESFWDNVGISELLYKVAVNALAFSGLF